MATPIDLDRYCARVGYEGNRDPTIDTLTALHHAHVQAIPFENLDPLLGIAPKLDAASLNEKLVEQHRGGYCFEHNLLFRHVLERLGFRVTSLAARVMWNARADATMPRSHMLLRIDHADGPYIADTGFGSLTLTAPLRFELDVSQPTPHESFRITGGGDGLYRMEAAIGATWRPLYEFDLQPQQLVDYEVVNWFLSTNTRSQFMHNLVAARADGDRRYALRNASFAVHHAAGWTDRRTLTSIAALADALTGALGLTIPHHPEFDRVLARIVASTTTASSAPAPPQ